MKTICNFFNRLSNRIKVSATVSAWLIGSISTVMSILGVSLNDWTCNVWNSIWIIVLLFFLLFILSYFIIGKIYKESITMVIRQTPVSIECGDIFGMDGLKVIGCDTHFDTRIDDVVISKKSLHGQMFLRHGNIEEIKTTVEKEAQKLHLETDDEGLYRFPLGTIIKYNSSVDNEKYLMLAMTNLNKEYESHTNMAEFEQMLIKMWHEIDKIYASNDIVLPLLGSGISRFDDGPKEKEALLKCMLCTLNASGVSLNANVKIVLYENAKDIPLFEYKNLFKSIQK